MTAPGPDAGSAGPPGNGSPGSGTAGPLAPGALDGLVIADFSRVLAGPYATMLMGDLGAEVIKIERPGTGDDTRHWGPPWTEDGESTYFLAVNRNKASVALDLGNDKGRERALRLVARADVLVENFRPGTMERLGLGYQEVHRVNPRLVYCSISGFGAQSALPGYDLLIQAVGGLMSVTGTDPEHPVKAGVALVDVVTGLHALVGILAALRHRERTGQGQHIEVNLLSSLLSALVNQASGYVSGGVVPKAMGNRHPSIAPYEVFATADRPLVLAVGNDGQFRALAKVLGLADLPDDDRFATNDARVRNRDALARLIEAALADRPAQDWFAALTGAGVPCGPVNDIAGAFELAERLGLAPIEELTDPSGRLTRHIAHPIRFSATPARVRSAPPALGADNERLSGVKEDG